MSDLLGKCSVCHAIVDEEDLFCANCGTETPHASQSTANITTAVATHNFQCQGCGASMSYDASARTLRCPFCGSEKLEAEHDVKVLRPSRVVPFAIDESAALVKLREWLGSSFWRPGDLARAAVVLKLRRVFVPYWVFSARTYTFWTADSSQTPSHSRSGWFPVSGDHRGEYSGVLIGASGVLLPAETSALAPFDLRPAVPPEQVDLDNVVYEQFRVPRKYARPLAQQGFENLELQACRQYVPGNCRNLKVNVRVEGLSAEPMLLPIWVMAYQYRDQTFRFLVNGQTGRCTGTAPFSWQKAFGVAAIIIVAILLVLLVLGLAGMWSSGR
jgi:RNA polymerase subunit RPABC4/transcription elongation factor Spt4